MTLNEPIQGRITFLSEEGWGFILSDAIKFTRIFFHWTELSRKTMNYKDLKRDMKVSFIAIDVPDKGWRAIRIEVIDNVLSKTEERNIGVDTEDSKRDPSPRITE